MTLEEEWLASFLADSTKDHHTRGLRYFKEFLGNVTTERLVEMKKEERTFETRVIMFYKWLQETKGHTGNTARSYIIGVQSFFSYVGLPLRLKRKLPKLHMKLEGYRPTSEDIQKLYKYGDLQIKAWVALSRDCPARISDLLKITPKQIQQEDFLIKSQKENVVGKVYISEETQGLFKMLEGKVTLPTTQRGVDKLLQRACKNAGIPHKINQHLLRKLWISTATNLNINQVIIKILSFKTVPEDVLTYFLDREDLRNAWQRVIDVLPLEPRTNNRVGDIEKTVDVLKETLGTLEKENMVLKTRVDNLQSNTMKLEERLNEIGGFVAQTVEFGKYTEKEKEALRKKYNIREFSEEEKQLMKDYLEMSRELQKEKGYLDEKDMVEFKKRFKAKLKKREKAKKDRP